MLRPYNISREDGLSYYFKTDYGVEYVVYFMDYSFMFGDFLPVSVPIYTFNIEVFQTPEKTTHLSTPIDKRIEATIKYILTQFFDCIDNVMIYIFDNLDSRHQARERKFDNWFKSAKISDIEKINFKTITDDFEVLSAILLHSQNPYKKQIIALMTQLNDNDFMPL